MCLGIRLAVARGDDEPGIAVVLLKRIFELVLIDFDCEAFPIAFDKGVGDGVDEFFFCGYIDGKKLKFLEIFGAFQCEGKAAGRFLGHADKFGHSSRQFAIH